MFATEQAALCGRGPSFYGNILLWFGLPRLLLRVKAIVDWVSSTFLISVVSE